MAIQPEITFNAPIPNRQGQPKGKNAAHAPAANKAINGSANSQNAKKGQAPASATHAKSKNSSAAASPVEEKSAPSMQKTASSQSKRSNKGGEKAASQAKAEPQQTAVPAETVASKSTLRPEAEAHQPFIPPAQPERRPSSSKIPADAGLPNKPLGSKDTPRLSTMQHTRPPITPSDSQLSVQSSLASTSGPSPAITPSLSAASTNTTTGPSTTPSTQAGSTSGATEISEQLGSPPRNYQNQAPPYFNGPRKARGAGSAATRSTRGGAAAGSSRGAFAGNAGTRNTATNTYNKYSNGHHQSNFHDPYAGQYFYDPSTGQPIPYYSPPSHPQYSGYPGQFYDQNQAYSNTSSPPSHNQILPYPQNGSAFNPYTPPQMSFYHTPEQMQQQMYERPAPLFDYSFYAFPNDGGSAFYVLGQIEFYFSKDNLVRDSWMRQKVSLAAQPVCSNVY